MRSTTPLLRIAGIAATVLGLFLYRSYENRALLGLWSPAYAMVLILAVGALVSCVAIALRSRRLGRQPGLPARVFDLATFFWGIAYLWSALDDPAVAGRLVELNLFGSVAPGAALLEWVAMGLGFVAIVVGTGGRLGESGRKVLLSLSALAFVGLVGEGLLRLRAAVAPHTQGFPTYTAEQWDRKHVTLNSEGFRDVEHPASSPLGVLRLLVVGDSYAFGSGVNDTEDRVGEQLARLLTDRLGESWQSVSAALGNSHTLEEITYLERLAAYDRDAVLLVYVFNDIDYLAPVTSRTVRTQHPESILDRIHPARLSFVNSYLVQEIFVRGRMAGYRLRDAPPPSAELYADPEILDRHLADLLRFVELASADGVPVWIAPFDIAAGDGGLFAARYEHFRQRALARGLPILSLAGAFRGYDPALLRVNSLDGHPNEEAHRLAAEALVGPMVDALAPSARGR